MNEALGANHSSDSITFTRVISRRKQARKTVGITINPQLLEEARNRNLNISRICEQALASIIDYIPQETGTVSSKSLTGCSLPRENPRADSSAWHERRIRNGKPAVSQLPSVDWDGFRSWVDREFRPRVADDRFRYAKEYSDCLLNGDFSRLTELKIDKRLHVLAALSALSKFLGIHDNFKILVGSYGLKWNVRSDELLISRLTKKKDADAILGWVRLVKTKCPELKDFMDFMMTTGLRYDEGIEGYNLIIKLARDGKLSQYYNDDKAILEHYRFKEIFIRRTKKAFISYVSKELIQRISVHRLLNIHSVQSKVRRKCQKLGFSDIREYFATFMTRYLSQSEIDFLQGRVSGSVFMRNYFNPSLLSDLRERALKGITDMKVLYSDSRA